MKTSKKANVPLVETELKRHFRNEPLHDLITASRGFPPTARVDLQLALEKMFSEQRNAKLVGVHSHFGHQMPLTIAHLLGSQHFPVVVGPLQHDEVDIGETLPARCLRPERPGLSSLADFLMSLRSLYGERLPIEAR